MNRFLIIFVVLALASCAGMLDKKPADKTGSTRILYSPTGDPLNGGPLGKPTCAEAMKHWFDRVDTKHDGIITLDEFLNDAKAQFQRMDIDKNGYLVSEEVERFRMTYRDYAAGEKPSAAVNQDDYHGREHGNNGSGENGGGNVIDAVMSADTNLDYKVTPDEFAAYSQKVFKSLDTDHKGTLNQVRVTTAYCGSKP